MSCVTCGHTMEGLDCGYYWCPRCGTLKEQQGREVVTVPKLVERCRVASQHLTELRRLQAAAEAEYAGQPHAVVRPAENAYVNAILTHGPALLAAAEADAGRLRERPVSKEGRPMNRRKGRMVQAPELLKEIQGIMDKFGDTCFYVTGLAWGSVALWEQSDYDAALAGAGKEGTGRNPVAEGEGIR